MRKHGLIVAIVLVCLFVLASSVSAQSANLIVNGSFEDGFTNGLATGWTAFNNGGLATYGYDKDAWERTVYDGGYSQIIGISTMGYGGSEKDRYNGIYQVVKVVPGQRYMFSFYGLVRSSEGTEVKSSYNYRIEVGFDYNGGTDPWAVTEWTEMDRWPETNFKTPAAYSGYAHGVTPTSDKLTVFIRLWKKFPTGKEEGAANIDAVSLLGPAPAGSATTSSTGESLPATGAGSLLPLLGGGLGLAALTLTSLRLARRRA